MKYDFDLDMESRNSLSLIIGRIKENSTVLEFGPANGRMTKYLKEKLNCKVYAVEIDKEAAKNVVKYSKKIIIDSIENYKWLEEFQDISFDYIVFADVLEHLYWPQKVLSSAVSLLKNDGSLLLSIPNIGHNAIVIDILKDKFTYRKTGLLDDTHIRFFTKKTLDELINLCGLKIQYETGSYASPSETEFQYCYEELDQSISSFLMNREFGEVYQFVIEAKKNIKDPLIDFQKPVKRILYIDTGKGFNETEKLIIETDANQLTYKFDIEKFTNMSRLRFDLCERAVEVILQSIEIDDINYIQYIDHNGIEKEKNKIREIKFLNNDPQIIIGIEKYNAPKEIILKFKKLQYIDNLTEQQIQEKEQQIESKEQQIQEKEQQIEEKEQQIENKDQEIHRLNEIAQSLRVRNRIKNLLKKILPISIYDLLVILKNDGLWVIFRKIKQKFAHASKARMLFITLKDKPDILKKVYWFYQRHGFMQTVRKLKVVISLELQKLSRFTSIDKNNFKESKQLEPYEAWKEVNHFNAKKIEVLNYNLKNIQLKPKISIIIPLYNPPLQFLKKAIDSVDKQLYDNWEICIVDDKSTNAFVVPFLENLCKNNPKIKVHYNEKNMHISLATNKAVEISDGDYLIFLDQDDELTLDALAEVVLYIDKNMDTDILYSDDDKIDRNGNCFAPQFKPAWSPEFLLSFMYAGHLKCVKKSLYIFVGGFRQGFEGSQDYDFYLRASEDAKHIGHIPKVLYHWRVVPGSTAAGGNEKNYSFSSGVKAVQDTLNRRHIKAKAYQPDWAEQNGNGIYAIDFPDEGRSVGIIIPTKNGLNLIKRCIESLDKTTYKNYRVYVIDNESDDSKTIAYLDSLKHQVLKIGSIDDKFSFSYLNNEAVKSVKEELLLFLNNDTEVINPKWLSQMVGYLQFKGVGSVGARLIFPDERIQHAGIVHGITHGFPVPAFKLLPKWDWGYMASSVTSKNYLAVTAACMLTPRLVFEELGGFDDKDFSVAFNDCDYGYRLYQSGYRNVLCPEAELYHYEGATRGYSDRPNEEAAYIRKYGNLIDPYYNPNLALNCTDFSIDSKVVVLHQIPKFKLLMVTHNLNFEGAPKSFYELAKELKRRGNIEPVILSHAPGPLIELYQEEKIEVTIIEDFNLLQLKNEKLVDKFIERMSNHIKSLDVDVIYGNTIQTFWAIQVAKMLNIPSVWNIRESEEPFSSFDHSIVIKNSAKGAIDYPYKVVFVADATKDVYEPLNKHHNFMTIYNGFDKELAERKTTFLERDVVRKNLNIPKETLNILIAGTVCDRKGQMDLIKAIELLDENIVNNMTFHIVGDRKSLVYSKIMHEYIKKLSPIKQKRIQVFDETNEIYKHYLAADVFVCSSRVESFPKVIQEAMYYELAIITTPVFGIIEQVKDNISALYYQPDDIGLLAEHILAIYEDSKLREKLSKNAKISLDILPTLDEMSSKYELVFQETLLSGESR